MYVPSFEKDALSCASVFTEIFVSILYGMKRTSRIEWVFERPWGLIVLSLFDKCRHHRWKWEERIKTSNSSIIHLTSVEGTARGFEDRTNLWTVSITSVDGKHTQRHYGHYEKGLHWNERSAIMEWKEEIVYS